MNGSVPDVVADGDCDVERKVAGGCTASISARGCTSEQGTPQLVALETVNLKYKTYSSQGYYDLKSCARNIALTRSKLKTYAISNYYMYTTNMWSTRDKW